MAVVLLVISEPEEQVLILKCVVPVDVDDLQVVNEGVTELYSLGNIFRMPG